ncbi:MAG: hypothetical protein J0H64_05810 [Actinobacteria bacterium]|nr:hypothetical protein [Actinomycetota bacterium]
MLAFFGTAAMAPFSVSNARADRSEAAMLEVQDTQALASTAWFDPAAADLRISDVVRIAGSAGEHAPSGALYTLQQFMFSGAVSWGGYKFTYYSQQVLPGAGLSIPGRHVNEAGYVSDSDGYIVVAGSAPIGTVYATPFGYKGKIYDRGTVGNHLDVYIR